MQEQIVITRNQFNRRKLGSYYISHVIQDSMLYYPNKTTAVQRSISICDIIIQCNNDDSFVFFIHIP